jgi:hypothetical protein
LLITRNFQNINESAAPYTIILHNVIIYCYIIIYYYYSSIHSIGMCRMRRFLAVLRSFFHSSLLCTFSCHSSPRTILLTSLNSSCHLFLGLHLGLVDSKFIYNTLLGIPFFSFSVHVQINVIYVSLLSLLW